MSHEFSIIREENGDQPSVDDQVTVARALYDEGVLSEEEALKEDEIAELLKERGDELEYKLRTSLDNLRDIPVIVGYFPPGSRYVPISERRDEIIFGEVEETVRVDREALLDHVHDDDPDEEDELPLTADGRGVTVREVISVDTDIDPEEVEHYLHTGNRDTQRERLNDAIDAIVDSNEVTKRDDYGKVVFRHKAYRYNLI
jgi:cation transport regulator ChaB